jgi:hypothetical protein
MQIRYKKSLIQLYPQIKKNANILIILSNYVLAFLIFYDIIYVDDFYIMNFQSLYIRISSQFDKIQIAFLGAVEITSTCSAEKFNQIDFLNFKSSSFDLSHA